MATLDDIRAKREAILEIAKRHGVERLRLFGSVVRGEDRPDSDLDILVQFGPKRSLLDLAGFGLDMEELLGRKVDVVSEGGISRFLEPYILAEATEL